MSSSADQPLNAFCVDLEEWFHICGVPTDYSNPASWNGAVTNVVSETDVLMRILDDAGAKGTFLTVGWVAEKYPDMIRALVDAGHEIGCHSYHHQLVYSLTPEEFEKDLVRALEVLRRVSGQAVNAYRAPGFSMKRECFWAFPILKKHGIDVDVSIVPAVRDHGGVANITRDPFLLHLEEGDIQVFPVSVMDIAGRAIPFSGGGYLRLFPQMQINAGFRSNHRAGRPVMSYIHPREINPQQPRLTLPALKSFKYYVNMTSTEPKLRRMLDTFRFSTVAETIATVKHWPEYNYVDGDIIAAEAVA
jgi:polysaccharide deacetylase family protein (PEP-CTERM system associated)